MLLAARCSATEGAGRAPGREVQGYGGSEEQMTEQSPHRIRQMGMLTKFNNARTSSRSAKGSAGIIPFPIIFSCTSSIIAIRPPIFYFKKTQNMSLPKKQRQRLSRYDENMSSQNVLSCRRFGDKDNTFCGGLPRKPERTWVKDDCALNRCSPAICMCSVRASSASCG